jgi:hypothetical protein
MTSRRQQRLTKPNQAQIGFSVPHMRYYTMMLITVMPPQEPPVRSCR